MQIDVDKLELSEKDIRDMEVEYKRLAKQYGKVVKQNKELQKALEEARQQCIQWASIYEIEKKANLVLAEQLKLRQELKV